MGKAERFTISMRLRMTGMRSYTEKYSFTTTSLIALLPRSVKTNSRPVADSLFSAQRRRAHLISSCMGTTSKSSTKNDSGTVVSPSNHSSLI